MNDFLLIAHISDLHLNSFYNDSVFKNINLLLKNISERNVDHLIITGDLTDNAAEKDLDLLRKSLKKYGFLSGEKLSIVIGNHDIFGGVQKAEDIFTFPEKCSSINYSDKVRNFISYFPEAFDNCDYLSTKDFFPFSKRINNALLIGLNSVAEYSNLSNPFGSNGEISSSQFGETYDIFKSVPKDIKYRIVLIHHHFNKLKLHSKSTFGSLWGNIEKQTMKLRNKRRLFNLFKEFNVDIVLHGHVHESKEYFRKGVRFLNSGATIKNSHNSVIVNYLHLNKGRININIETIKLQSKKREDSSRPDRNDYHKLINAALIS